MTDFTNIVAQYDYSIEENEGYKKQIAEIAKEKTIQLKKALLEHSEQINGHNVVRINESRDLVMLRDAATMLQKEARNLVIAAAFESAGKPQLLLMYSQDLVEAGKNAGADIREAAKLIQGGGGGQPGLATAGGKDKVIAQKIIIKIIVVLQRFVMQLNYR